MKMSDSVSVVIPTLNAEPEIEDLLALLEAQTFAPREIIVIDSSSDDHTVEIAKAHPLVRVIEIQRKDFDHGGTRNLGFNESVGDFVLFMTQDAVPVDEFLLEKLLRTGMLPLRLRVNFRKRMRDPLRDWLGNSTTQTNPINDPRKTLRGLELKLFSRLMFAACTAAHPSA